MPEAAISSAPQVLQCSEVWGGNEAVDRGVVMQGLDAWVVSRPHAGDDQGGDIHYLSSCATGRITRMLVADVSGHGQQVADLARRLRDLMRRYMNYVDQGKLVAGLNNEFSREASAGRFATAIVATFWAPTDELDITNAGHPKPLIFRAATRTWEPLGDRAAPSTKADAAEPDDDATDNIPLGILDDTAYSHTRVRLRPGDLALFYTDALLEARAPGGPLLGLAGLMDIITALDASKPEQLLTAALDALRRHAGGPLDDDATMLLLRTNALKPRISFVAGVITSVRMAKQLARSLLPGGERFAWPQFGLTNLAGAFFAKLNGR